MDFTYDIPNEKSYFIKLLEYLDIKGHSDIAHLLQGGYCTIQHGEQYSGGRWNAFFTTVYFYVTIDNLGKFSEQMKKNLVKVCNELVPKNAGLDVMEVEISLHYWKT